MLRSRSKFALASAGVAALAMAIPSCASILGIEELKPGTLSAGGSSMGGASGASGGAAGSGGSSGGAGSGVAGSTTGGAGRAGSGGQPIDGGGSDARDGGIEGGPTAITVHGTVIDYWRHRVPNVEVYLGAATATTDAGGQFTFNNVTPPYDIGLAVRVGLIPFGGSEDAWLFRGLTRTDPTLQVKDGLVPSSSTGNTWTFQNFPAAPTNDAGLVPRTIGIAFGSPDTVWGGTFSDPDGTDLGASYIDFEGGASSAGTAHALLWEIPVRDTVSPTRYVAYDEKPLTIDVATTKSVTFDMAPDGTTADQVAVTINSAVAGAVEIDGYVRFDDGAPIHVVQVTNAGQAFQMLMPKITGSSITVSALVGTTPAGPFSLAHLDGLTPGQVSVALTVPAPVSPVAPVAGASNVGANAMFQWSASPHVALLYVYCPGPMSSDGPTRFFVVTNDNKTQLPILGGATGIPWPKGRQCQWAVEVHGAYATVDQASSPTGFFDSHGYYYYGELWGPKRDNGSFTVSDGFYVNTAP